MASNLNNMENDCERFAREGEQVPTRETESLVQQDPEANTSREQAVLDSAATVKFSDDVSSRLLCALKEEEVKNSDEKMEGELDVPSIKVTGGGDPSSVCTLASGTDNIKNELNDDMRENILLKDEVVVKKETIEESYVHGSVGEKSVDVQGKHTTECRGSGDTLPKLEPVRTAPPSDTDKDKKKEVTGSVSVFDYMYGELRRGYLLENDEQRFLERREKFYMFFRIPKELEKFIMYGFFQCVDAFLFMFTFLPLRSVLSLWFLVTRSFQCVASALFASRKVPARLLQPAELCDLIKGIIVIIVSILMSYIDTSMMYHIVKSQSVIKLYIMFNMLEVADKLFSSFGQDILDALYWTATEPRGRKREHIGLVPHLFFSIVYVFAHSIIVLLQATTLSVAINYPNTALLTVMLSNNFVELKSMVFKKFEKNNLFQMSCSDVRERFHFLILLFLVILQTMKQYNWNYDQFMILLPYCIGVLGAEVVVDWMKHAFVTRFNEISPKVYSDYAVSLAYDLASCKLKSAFSDHTDLISRRMGFIPLPLGALVLRVVFGSIPIVGLFGYISFFFFYLCLMSMKLWISIVLLGKACSKIEAYRNSQKEKLLAPRQCNSLPSSRHQSTENLHDIAKTAKSMPQSQSASVSSSLADIAAQAEIRQETMEHNILFSNSTVTLDNIGSINDSVFINEQFSEETQPDTGAKWKSTATFGGILRLPPHETPKRRISLQETITKEGEDPQA